MDELNEAMFENEYLTSEGEVGELEGQEQYGMGYGPGSGGYGRHHRRRQLTEEQELDLATELLSLSHDQELEQFLGDLIKKVGSFAGKVIKSPVGQALGGLVKQVAKKALPIVGGALGTFVGGPAGTALGSQLGSAASRMFGLELEGMTGEDRELEVAQRVVRLTADAAQQAAQAPPGAPPQQVARAALAAAAARHAPGLLRGGIGSAPPAAGGSHPAQGRWIRRGKNLVVLNT
jgi:uncharacterized protein (DUF697 family)